ncbi:magnesium transporter MRS2-3-like isoform X3 [Fagus crenata]
MRAPKAGLFQPEDELDATRPILSGLSLLGHRKKATGVRAWMVVDSKGQEEVIEAGKHSIMRRTGLPTRDLRILDPLLSYPSTVLGRERAIVINLEHIKAIITANEVLLLNSRDLSAIPFVEELQRRLLRHYHATTAQAKTELSEASLLCTFNTGFLFPGPKHPRRCFKLCSLSQQCLHRPKKPYLGFGHS